MRNHVGQFHIWRRPVRVVALGIGVWVIDCWLGAECSAHQFGFVALAAWLHQGFETPLDILG